MGDWHMRRLMVSLILVIIAVLFTGSAAAQDSLSIVDEPGEGWIAITPGGETTCALGTPYTFFARPGSSDNLLIQFQGGGMCWDAGTCGFRMSMRPTYTAEVNVSDIQDYTAGIFDVNNPENPFKDYDMVFVSYCTGDVHLGNNVVEYEGAEGTVEFQHKGYVNATAALDWTYENFPNPESVFVTGCSAGSIASPFYADRIIDHYEVVPVVQLGDAAGAYRGNLLIPLTEWATLSILPDVQEYSDFTASTLTFNDFYKVAAARHPENWFSQVNSANDATQSFFLRLFGGGISVEKIMAENMAEISESAPNYRYYTAWGDGHCLTPIPEFYTYQVNGVRLRDWVANLVAGEDVDSVQCTDCKKPEVFEAAS
jgi:hypothetical protein